MKRFVAVLAVVAAGWLSACEKTEYVEQMDAGTQEDGGRQDDAATTLARTAEIFNRVRGDAYRILGKPLDPGNAPLARFLAPRPL